MQFFPFWGKNTPKIPRPIVHPHFLDLLIFPHFSKSGSGWTGGITNVYHDPCQDWLNLVDMKLTSPNFPEVFNPLENCTWRITAPQGHYVTLDFQQIDVLHTY